MQLCWWSGLSVSKPLNALASAVPGCSHEASNHEEVFKEAGDSSGLRETDIGPVKGLEMPGPASPRIAPLPQASEEEVASPQTPLPVTLLTQAPDLVLDVLLPGVIRADEAIPDIQQVQGENVAPDT